MIASHAVAGERELLAKYRHIGHNPGDREVTIFYQAAAPNRIVAAKVFARSNETLDPIDTIRRAHLFRFESGTYEDSSIDYFVANTAIPAKPGKR